MKKVKYSAILATILAILLVSSTFALFVNFSGGATTDYGDITQYDWPQGGSDEGNTGYNPGPAPNKPNVIWSTPVSGSGMVSVFNGLAFVIQGTIIAGSQGARLYAFDAYTGERRWVAECPAPMRGVSGVQKLDDTYLLGFDNSFMAAIRIANGQVAWTQSIPGGGGHPGSGSYFAGHYSDTLKMHFQQAWNGSSNTALIHGYDLSDPSKAPTLAWTKPSDHAVEILATGDGKLFVGSTEATVIAIDGKTGERLWQSPTGGGLAQQHAIYADGRLYISAVTWQIICYDADTGELIWRTEKGDRAFSAYSGTLGMGMIFDTTVELDPHGTVRAWDLETGEELWRQPAYFNIAYTTMACGDGKVYTATCDQAAGIRTGGLAMPGYETACFDAYTGAVLWRLKGKSFSTPSIAYGNLYGISGGLLYCVGDGNSADWNYGLHGNLENHRVAVGQSGPADISTPKWTFQAGADVSSSPAVVDGKVYIGSSDKNWYCLDAYTGAKIWNHSIGHYVRSSAAVVGGKVFTGADDGYFYCLDAATGNELWKTSAGGHFPYMFTPIEFQSRSSPIVVDNKVYVGSLDGKLYCLNPSTGQVLSSYDTKSPIFGSPAYANNTIYIVSTDFFLYALNAADLSLKWKSISLAMDIAISDRDKLTSVHTPTVVGGVVYTGAGVYSGNAKPGIDYYPHSVPAGAWGGAMRFMAFNATTGASLWNQTRSGQTPVMVPVYWKGQIYGTDFFYISSMNVSAPGSGPVLLGDSGGHVAARRAGNRTWATWLGYQISSQPAYANGLTGERLYVGSDIGTLYALDATNGNTLSIYKVGANVPSSPAIWDGKLYVGSINGKVYCFDDSPVVDMELRTWTNKGSEMHSGETLEINGHLLSNPAWQVWDPASSKYVSSPSNYHPAIPNATVHVSITNPDMSTVNYTATTDNKGFFMVSHVPNTSGSYGWVAWYEGEVKPAVAYAAANSDYITLTVTSPQSANPTTTTQPGQPTTFNVMDIAIPLIVIVVVVALALGVFMLRRKK